jgi:hypothetical protein
MTKSKKISPTPLSNLPLFEWVKSAQSLSSQSPSPPSGSLDIDSELRAAISADIKAAAFSRYALAARMSELVGHEITESMLNNWTAEAHEKHRFPCQFLPAFVAATGGRRAFECLSRKSGLFALPGPEAVYSEVAQIDEQMKKLRIKRKERLDYLKLRGKVGQGDHI